MGRKGKSQFGEKQNKNEDEDEYPFPTQGRRDSDLSIIWEERGFDNVNVNVNVDDEGKHYCDDKPIGKLGETKA